MTSQKTRRHEGLGRNGRSQSPSALITGASRGLGLALARALAGRGWNLIVDARGAEALDAAREALAGLRGKDGKVLAVAGDVSDPAHRAALAQAAAELGGLDAIVNNAGVLGPSPQPALLDYPLETLERVLRINALAPLALVQALRPTLHPGARILNVTSDAAVEAYPGWGGYGASKAALEQWTAILAAEQTHWQVYAVDPGDMRTAMHQAAFPGEDIGDRPLPEVAVPGFVALLESRPAPPSGRYRAAEIALLEPSSPKNGTHSKTEDRVQPTRSAPAIEGPGR